MSKEIPVPRGGFAERLTRVEADVAALRGALGGVSLNALSAVDLFAFEGGKPPVRMTHGAAGYDAFVRAVVDPKTKPTTDEPLRQTLADFHKIPGYLHHVDETLRERVRDDPRAPDDKYGIVIPPGEICMAGLGFAVKMPFPMYFSMQPRSGFATDGITIANAPGTIDSDYRGEAGALIMNNSRKDFLITHEQRIVQAIFSLALVPTLNEVQNHSDLDGTERGAGGFGSTGTH